MEKKKTGEEVELHVVNEGRIAAVTPKQKLYTERDFKRLAKGFQPILREEMAQISVAVGDTIQVSRSLQLEGYNPAAINMANQYRPGGGYLEGSMAQEESLCRRSFLHHYLIANLDWYPMETRGGCIYNPDVLVFRSPEAEGCKTLDEPFELAFLTCAAPSRPELRNKRFEIGRFGLNKEANDFISGVISQHIGEIDKTLLFSRDVENEFVEKIRSILLVALDNGHDSVVLGAWGCGAFGCPALQVALLHRRVIFSDPRFLYGFRKIVFAIIEDNNSRGRHNLKGNVFPFQLVFSDLCPLPSLDPSSSSSADVPSSSFDPHPD